MEADGLFGVDGVVCIDEVERRLRAGWVVEVMMMLGGDGLRLSISS